MREDSKKSPRDPVVTVAPYARIRIIVAVVVLLCAIVVIGYHWMIG